MNITMVLSLVKIIAVIAYLYGLFWLLGVESKAHSQVGRQIKSISACLLNAWVRQLRLR